MADCCSRVFPGILMLILVCILWTFSTEVSSFLIKEDSKKESPSNNNQMDNYEHRSHNPKTGAYFLTYFKSALLSIFLWIILSFHLYKKGCFRRKDDSVIVLSESHYVPVKNAENQYDWNSECFGEETAQEETTQKSVRFKSLCEVRHMVKCKPVSKSEVSSSHYGIREQAYLAIQCVSLWFLANYFYALALRFSEANTANLLSLASSIFILLFGVAVPSSTNDRLTITKIVAVSLMVCGAVLAGISDTSIKATPMGVGFALTSAFLFAAYLALMKRKCPRQSTTGVLSVLGFMGLYCLIFFWPVLIILHVFDIEQFEIPTDRDVLNLLTTSSLIGSAIGNALWLIGAYMTSSLTATLSLSLTIPVALLADWIIHNVSVGVIEAAATIPMFIGFALGAMTSQGESWDPVFTCLKSCFSSCRNHYTKWIFQKVALKWKLRTSSRSSGDIQSCSLLSAVDDSDSSTFT